MKSKHKFPLTRSYRGDISKTKSGLTCQKWTDQSPHKHTRTPTNYENEGLGNHNFCRNPDSDDPDMKGAWCYTTDSATRWEYCTCQGLKFSTYDTSSHSWQLFRTCRCFSIRYQVCFLYLTIWYREVCRVKSEELIR